MYFKVLALVAVVAIVNAGPLAGGYGGYHHSSGDDYGHHEIQEDKHVDYYAYPKYEFKYGIEDPHTGDYKSQHETRDGDEVKGEYSYLDADGKFVKVQYTSDKHSGYQAIVTKDGHLIHPAPAHPQEHEHGYHH